MKKASSQLDIPYYSLADWRSERKRHGANAFVGSGHSYEDAGKSSRELQSEKENP